MKFKFAPKGDYRPQQLITIEGDEYMVEAVYHTGNLIAVKQAPGFERITVVVTDEPPIEEIKPPPGYTADELDRDNPYNQWMEET